VAVAFPHPTFLSGSGAARLTATVALSFTQFSRALDRVLEIYQS